MTKKVVCPLLWSFKTILKSIRQFYVDRLPEMYISIPIPKADFF